jgi:hypothetical protein
LKKTLYISRDLGQFHAGSELMEAYWAKKTVKKLEKVQKNR